MKRPKNFEKIYNTSVWWHSFEIGKQVEASVLPASYVREELSSTDYDCIWLTELELEYNMTHRMMLEINWKEELFLIHFVKEGDGDDSVIVETQKTSPTDFASYRVFVKVLNSLTKRHSHRFWATK